MRLHLVLGSLAVLYLIFVFWPGPPGEQITLGRRLQRGAQRLRVFMVGLLGLSGVGCIGVGCEMAVRGSDDYVGMALWVGTGGVLLFLAWRVWLGRRPLAR